MDGLENGAEMTCGYAGDLVWRWSPFHEYLGVAGIEKNGTSDIRSYAQYPVSKGLLPFASPKTITRYELGGKRVTYSPSSRYLPLPENQVIKGSVEKLPAIYLPYDAWISTNIFGGYAISDVGDGSGGHRSIETETKVKCNPDPRFRGQMLPGGIILHPGETFVLKGFIQFICR